MRFGLKQAVFFPLYSAAAVRQTHIQLKSIQKEYAGPFFLAHIQYILSTVKIQVQIWKTSLCWSWLHEKVNNGRRMKCYRTVFLIPEMLYGRRQTTASISKVWDGSCIISFPSSSKAKRLHRRTGKLISVSVLLHLWEHKVEIHNSSPDFVQLQGKEDITLMQGITKTGKVIQTFDIKLVQVLWWDEQTASCHSSLDWAVKEVHVLKPCA